MTPSTVRRPDAYRYDARIALTLGEPLGIHMERYYTMDFLFRRVLDRVEQLRTIAVGVPPNLWMHTLPSTIMHTMRAYVIEEASDHAYWVAEGDTRIWRYRWPSDCGTLVVRVESDPPLLVTAGTRLEICHEVPPWCRPCVACAGRRVRRQ
jgi:hypothetical protein